MNDDRRYAIATAVIAWAAFLFTLWFVGDIIQIVRGGTRIALSWEMVGALWTFIFAGVVILAQPMVRKVEKKNDKNETETTIEVEVSDGSTAGSLGTTTKE